MHTLDPETGTFRPYPGRSNWTSSRFQQIPTGKTVWQDVRRPDRERTSIVALVQMNTLHLHLHAVAGTTYPGAELGHPGPGVIPLAVQRGPSLVAAFNGGFQYKDGHYGMTVGPETYVPLQLGTGTLTLYQNGNLTLTRYAGAVAQASAVEAIRQNGPLIVDQGQVTSDTASGGYATWGRTTTNSMYTWRSGMGLTEPATSSTP